METHITGSIAEKSRRCKRHGVSTQVKFADKVDHCKPEVGAGRKKPLGARQFPR
jgi:hypothetical protein